jgi:hypothetical protein
VHEGRGLGWLDTEAHRRCLVGGVARPLAEQRQSAVEEQRRGAIARKGSGVGCLFIPSQRIRRVTQTWGGNTRGGVGWSLARCACERGIQSVGLVGQIYGGHGLALVEVALVRIWQVGPHWALCRAWLRLSNIPILFQKQGCFDLEKYQINPPLPHKIPKL